MHHHPTLIYTTPSVLTIIALRQQQFFNTRAWFGLGKKIANLFIETKNPSPIEGEEILLVPMSRSALPYSSLVYKEQTYLYVLDLRHTCHPFGSKLIEC